jgi:hypothetical protein
MHRYKLTVAILAAAVVAFTASYSQARDFIAKLNGFEELGSIPTTVTVPAIPSVPSPATTVTTSYTGAILSKGKGTVSLELDELAKTVTYRLTYSDVGTTSPLTGTVRFAHIQFGMARDTGGILVFFCTNAPFGPPDTTNTGPKPQPCPPNGGTVSGVWTKDNVQAIGGQNVQAGDFNALVQALKSNTAYANVHTTVLGGGEIRGQCVSEDREDREDDD